MINRRNFIKFLSSAAIINFILPVPFSYSQSNNDYRDSVISVLINLILPVKSIDIIKQTKILSGLNNKISENPKMNEIVEYGIRWLGFNSKLLYQKEKFVELKQEEQIEILNYTFNSTQSAYPAEPDKPWTDIRYGQLFLNNLRNFAINKFYTSEAGWKYVGYNGPPQFKGNPDYSICTN